MRQELFGDWGGGDENPMKVLVVMMGVGGFAGLINYLRTKRGLRTIGGLLLSVAISAFVGIEAHFVLKSMGVSAGMQFALAGICGYSGGALLDATLPMVVRYCHKRLGIEPPHPMRRTSDYARETESKSDEDKPPQDEPSEEETD